MGPELLYILAVIFALYMAWNIGANDVANAFGTSVGSGALTFKKALILAAIFEFAGAFLVGANVTDTIKGNIVNPDIFIGNPHNFAIGMLAALIASSLWLNIATFLGQPVSTTHAIIGAVIGFGVMSAGMDAVMWYKLGRIAASWFISPVAGAILAFLIYLAIKKFVLSTKNPVERAKAALPIGSASIVFIVTSSIVYDFGPRLLGMHKNKLMLIAIPSALVLSIIFAFIIRAIINHTSKNQEPGTLQTQYVTIERWFGRLQIATACYMSFAHGANDVANAVAPFAGVVQALKGSIAGKTEVSPWILAVGGVGIVLGLATYGYKVIEAVGKKITEVTPTRGFSAEFGTATTVLSCSLLGLPISTTFVLVGAVMGVGFARGFASIDLRVVRGIFASWLITIPISAGLCAIIYKIFVSFGA